MTKQEIESFLAIVESGSISHASHLLFITQSALSRRVQALERDIGFLLFVRNKGSRKLEITPEGKQFISTAKKWLALYQETQEIRNTGEYKNLCVSGINSINTCILDPVYEQFLKENPFIHLITRSLHSEETYHYVESGLVDIGFVREAMYSNILRSRAAFREKMYFICSTHADYPTLINPAKLNVNKQVRVLWNAEGQAWEKYWFGPSAQPMIHVDKVESIQRFLEFPEAWAVAPVSVIMHLEQTGRFQRHEISDAPKDRIVFYSTGPHCDVEAVDKFLNTLDQFLKNMPEVVRMIY